MLLHYSSTHYSIAIIDGLIVISGYLRVIIYDFVRYST